ncbi:FkbM family methyltransferase [Paracoccaceae bacterium GXU_MW_L88]
MTEESKDSEIDYESKLLASAQRLLDHLDQQIQLMGNPVDGTCVVFHEDESFNIALPWAAFEDLHFRIAHRHAAPDLVFYNQLFDLLPSLDGKAILDVGAFTGLQGLILRRFLAPSHVYMVEPLNMVQPVLQRTIEANPEGCPISLHQEIIDDGTSPMTRSSMPPKKTSAIAYLRRKDGKLTATTIDALGFDNLGLINLDIPGTKLYALNGAKETLETMRPVVTVNLAGRDVPEMKEFFEPLNYRFVAIGRHSGVFLPE